MTTPCCAMMEGKLQEEHARAEAWKTLAERKEAA